MEHDTNQTPRERLRAILSEKKRMRGKSYKNTSNFKQHFPKNKKVLGFRKQEEFGLKKRIKP